MVLTSFPGSIPPFHAGSVAAFSHTSRIPVELSSQSPPFHGLHFGCEASRVGGAALPAGTLQGLEARDQAIGAEGVHGTGVDPWESVKYLGHGKADFRWDFSDFSDGDDGMMDESHPKVLFYCRLSYKNLGYLRRLGDEIDMGINGTRYPL